MSTEDAGPREGFALKFTGPDTVEGWAIPFGRDADGESFTPATDFALDWFGKSGRPVLYDHGMDASQAHTVIGRQTDYEERAEGIWATAQLNRAAKYRKAIDRLIEQGQIGFSSGAMPHLAAIKTSGEITRWPWVELSLTPIPAHPATLVHYVKSADLMAHLDEVDTDVPAALIAAAMKRLDDLPNQDNLDALPDGAKFVDLLDRLTVDGVPWVRARKDWFGKSGRVLSAATRERLMAHPAALRQLAEDLDELLASADVPKEAKSADFWALAIEAEMAVARLLGVPFEGASTP